MTKICEYIKWMWSACPVAWMIIIGSILDVVLVNKLLSEREPIGTYICMFIIFGIGIFIVFLLSYFGIVEIIDRYDSIKSHFLRWWREKPK